MASKWVPCCFDNEVLTVKGKKCCFDCCLVKLTHGKLKHGKLHQFLTKTKYTLTKNFFWGYKDYSVHWCCYPPSFKIRSLTLDSPSLTRIIFSFNQDLGEVRINLHT